MKHSAIVVCPCLYTPPDTDRQHKVLAVALHLLAIKRGWLEVEIDFCHFDVGLSCEIDRVVAVLEELEAGDG